MKCENLSACVHELSVVVIHCSYILCFRFDSLTGVPNAQRTVGFEKGSVLFNIAALHTQIGARQVDHILCLFLSYIQSS